MRLSLLVPCGLALLLFAGSSQSEPQNDPNIASTGPRTPAEERKAFHLPPGFEIQLVASEPDIHKPMNLAFDDRGRLWMTESVEYPFPATHGKPRDAVMILEDFAEDGKARKVTTFADGLNIPIGVLPLTGGRHQQALVYSIPNVYRFTDGTDKDWADERAVLLRQFGYRDTHGMTNHFTIGFDGWVYATHGFSNTSTIKAADGSTITMQSGNAYRFRPDGRHVEQLTHGQVNPFGLSWDALGNLYSCDCHTQPIYQLLREGYYPSFGKPHDGLGFAPEMFTDYKDSTAIAGIAYYAADHFPPAFRDCAFIGDVVTHNIVQFRVAWNGATPKASLEYFLKCDDPWFRPVDIVLGPDGALYVADFYNRIIGHYEVPLTHPGRDRQRGRVWRIVYRGPDGKGKPVAPRTDWTKASVEELIQDLAHPNLTVRFKATQQLVAREDRQVEAEVLRLMQPGSNPFQRMHGLWILERRHALDDQTLAAAAQDIDRGVRVHAMRVMTERAALSPALQELAVTGLRDTDALVRRCAADVLGRHPTTGNMRPLLDLCETTPAEDTHLLYAGRVALRDQLQSAAAWANVPAQLRDEKDARTVADVTLGVPMPEAAAYLMEHIRHLPEDRALLVNHAHHIARHGTPYVTRQLLEFARDGKPADLDREAALLKAIAQGTEERGAKLSDEASAWAGDVTRRLLASKKGNQITAGIELAGLLKQTGSVEALRVVSTGRTNGESQRVAALTALQTIDTKGSVNLIGQLLQDAQEPIGFREQAANLLGRNNQEDALALLLQALPAAPARLQSVIAVALAGSAKGAEKLLEAVGQGKASARLLQERPVEIRLEQSKVEKLKERVARLTEGLPAPGQQLQQLLDRRHQGFLKAKGDPMAGAKVFEKSCAVCHQLGGKGAKVGPQLDGIGIRGLDRLLEDVLDPNRNVDQAFRSTTLQMKNGTLVTGLVLREEGEVIVLADKQGKEVRVPRKSVEERTTSQLSPMPDNFADQIREEEFYHLMAFLLAQRQQASK